MKPNNKVKIYIYGINNLKYLGPLKALNFYI